jgi:hypothetical protein
MDDQCKPDKKQLEQVLSCILGAPGQQLTFFLRAKSWGLV